ncbi:hypothetical protein B5M42_000195 [Paenibacillus athensensis]|uniref:Uncharacterized protein n=1 Tax=Paenibacillus athensensis TaxID=1967502 RepID=A0A4Y8PR52_9BACL|nr:hypothetical protein [Paenibacillus athensensis]MCD1257254.1 hypothetical protein [Paenibacillus athensensis]
MAFSIRPYEVKDKPDIAEFHYLFHLAYAYNDDFAPDRVFCNKATLGVAAHHAPALALYKSLGNELTDLHLPLVKELV